MQTMQDNRTTMMAGEGVPQRRAADQPLEWIEEGSHATLMTPERVLALLGTLNPGDNLAQTLAEQVEIEVRRALAAEQSELVEVVRTLAAVAHQHRNTAEANPHIGASYDCGHFLHHTQPMVQAAQRLCLRHGFSETGADLLGGEAPALNPEMMIERVEQGRRDFGDTYRWLRSEARRAGFNYVCEAIAFAAAKKGGA